MGVMDLISFDFIKVSNFAKKEIKRVLQTETGRQVPSVM